VSKQSCNVLIGGTRRGRFCGQKSGRHQLHSASAIGMRGGGLSWSICHVIREKRHASGRLQAKPSAQEQGNLTLISHFADNNCCESLLF